VSDEKKNLFERFSQFVLPLVVAVAALFQHQRSVALALIGFGCLSLVVSTVPWFLVKVREHTVKRREKQMAKAAMVEIGRHVRKFAQLTNLQNTDAIYYIVFNNLCGSNMGCYESLHVILPNIFAELCEQLSGRIADRDSSYKSLRATVNEFTYLVSSFCRYLVDPVYEQVPTRLMPEVLARYTPQVEGELIQYRERFVSFKDSYSDFLRELEERLPRPLGLGCYIQGPKPLKGLPGGKTIAQL
jgi:hypothetical protein